MPPDLLGDPQYLRRTKLMLLVVGSTVEIATKKVMLPGNGLLIGRESPEDRRN
jgi:hypothetical protein